MRSRAGKGCAVVVLLGLVLAGGLLLTSTGRENTVWVIGKYAGERALPLYVWLLDTEDPFVRFRAAEAIGRLGEAGRSAVPEVVRLLNDEDWLVRSEAAHALGQIGAATPLVLDALIRVVETPDLHTREAIEALGKLGPAARAAVSALQRHAQPGERYQADALSALEKILPDLEAGPAEKSPGELSPESEELLPESDDWP